MIRRITVCCAALALIVGFWNLSRQSEHDDSLSSTAVMVAAETEKPRLSVPPELTGPAPEPDFSPPSEGEAAADTGSLILRFVEEGSALPVIGVSVELAQEGGGRRSLGHASDRDGVIEFSSITAGLYRWQLKSRHDCEMTPPFEIPPVEREARGFQVNQVPAKTSGVIEVAPGEVRTMVVRVRPWAQVTGSLVMDSLPIEGPAFVKLLTREIVGDDPADSVDRVLERQHQWIEDGHFNFQKVRSGSMEILASWTDHDNVTRFLSQRFDLPAGTRRDLGPLSFKRGLSAKILVRAVGLDGAAVDISTLPPQRTFLVEPEEPSLDWTYMPQVYPVGEMFEVGGLHAGRWTLSDLGAEDVNDPDWKRQEGAELAFTAGLDEIQVIDEVWLRRVTAEFEIHVSDRVRPYDVRIFVADERGRGMQRHSCSLVDGTAKTHLPLTEGRRDILIVASSRDKTHGFSCHRPVDIGAESSTAAFFLQPCAWLEGKAGENIPGSGASVAAGPSAWAERGLWPYRQAVAGGGLMRLPVHPGRIQVKKSGRKLVLRQGEVHRLGTTDVDRFKR